MTIESLSLESNEVKDIDRVKKQTEEALNSLKIDIDQDQKSDTDFIEKQEDGNYKANINRVKIFLDKQKDKSTRTELTQENSGALISAIQIVLRAISNNNKYNLGKIDGILGDETKKAVAAFQKDNNIEGSQGNYDGYDGVPGPKTIAKILELLEKKGTETKFEGDEGKKEIHEDKIKDAVDQAINLDLKKGPEFTLPPAIWDNLNKNEQKETIKQRKEKTFADMPNKEELERISNVLAKDPEFIGQIIDHPNPWNDAAFLYKAMKGIGTNTKMIDRVFDKKRLSSQPLYYLTLVKQKFDQLYPDSEELTTFLKKDLSIYDINNRYDKYPKLILASIQKNKEEYNRILDTLD